MKTEETAPRVPIFASLIGGLVMTTLTIGVVVLSAVSMGQIDGSTREVNVEPSYDGPCEEAYHEDYLYEGTLNDVGIEEYCRRQRLPYDG